MVECLLKINSHSVRNLASLDKKVSFTCEVVDEDELRMKFAEYLLRLPADQCLKASFELVEN